MRTILVVEDSACIRKLVNVNLVNDGYHVISAADGMTALALLGSEKCRDDIGLIVLDLNLPDMPGKRIIDAVSQYKDTGKIPIVIMSGQEVDLPIEYPLIVATLYKPFRIQLLLDTIHSVVEAENEKAAVSF